MMSLQEIVTTVQPLANSQIGLTIIPIVLSAIISAIVALVTFHFKSKEAVSASVTWQWERYGDGSEEEAPFLSIQNRSEVPSYLISVRLLRGNFIRFECTRNVLSYQEYNEGSFPLEIRARSVSSFPLSMYRSDQALARANLLNKVIGYVFKRNYIWIEARTMSGRRLVIPANDSSNFRKRPLWVELRWIPYRNSGWSYDALKELRRKQKES